MGLLKRIFFSGLIITGLYSCSPYKQLDKDEYLLNRNIVKVDKPDLKEGIKAIIKQKANRKILGVFRFHLGVYTLGNRGKPTKFKNWLKYTVGEEPVILDTLYTHKSTSQIKLFMANNGYFNAEVKDTTIYRKKKAFVKYMITGKDPYRIKDIVRESADDNLDSLVLKDTINSPIQRGNVFRVDDLQKDRERITDRLRNRGYYFFNQQYISYRIDSAFNNYSLVVYQDVSKNETLDPDTKEVLKSESHKQYTIRNIYVGTDYDPMQKDTLTFAYDTLQYKGYYFLTKSNHEARIKPYVIASHTYLRPATLYKQTASDRTYKSLNLLGVYKFISINFFPVENSPNDTAQLDGFINLAPYVKQDYKVELEGTNNGGNLGVAGDVSYRNKNVFKGGELLELKLRGALESQKNFAGPESEDKIIFFNTYEAGIENSITLPKAAWPFSPLFRNKTSNPQTTFSSNYNIQNRPEFKRSILDFSASLEWRQNQYAKHIVTPFQVNFVNVTLDDAFAQKLRDLGDPILLSSYDNHLITNGRYSFVYSNQVLNKLANFTFFRINLEVAGNTLRLFKQLEKNVEPDTLGRYEILNKRFAQYVRPDIDLRFYHSLNAHNSIVYRIAGGIGVTYLNSVILPFEKSFYAGGSNDLRAFRARSVGPGAYASNDNFERIGDIKINGNVEYRFDILKILKGAFFVDAGNIWLRKFDESRPGGEFKINTFYKQLAVGSGLGFRFDFTFFIFRLDLGVPMVDPRYEKSDKWVIKHLNGRDLNFNFGIGYPF